MTNLVLILIVSVIVGGAIYYLFWQKKKGKCVGCPYSKSCNGHCDEE